MRVVLIGDNPRIAEQAALSVQLRWPDVTPVAATTAADGMRLVKQGLPDVVILHPGFSDLTLSEVILELRRLSTVPILVLGNPGRETEAVTALASGADDYIRFPYDPTEMMIRTWALVRRAGNRIPQVSESPIVSGSLLINPATREVFLAGEPVPLTATEFRLLHLLANDPGKAVSHSTLERVLWGSDVDSSDLLKQYVQRLRRKLGDDAQKPRWIACLRGKGYRFIGPPVEEPGPNGQATIRIADKLLVTAA